MVIVRLMGGLGNQFFQYAFGRQMANRLGVPLQFDLRWFANRLPGETARPYELTRYPIQASAAPAGSLPRVPMTIADKVIWSRFATIKIYERQHPGFCETAAIPRGNVLYVGYWQSEKYFRDVANEIRKELTPSSPPTGDNANFAASIRACTAVSLHVRRGDYANDRRTNAIHGLASLEYYRAALAHVQDRVPDARFFVFSDDLDWCRANLPLPADAVLVNGNAGAQAFEDIRLMSLCQHHIVANSSFSWWGAWLNPSASKIVVAPRTWFADPAIDATDLVPETWVRL